MNQLTTIRWSLEQVLEHYPTCSLPAVGVSWRKLVEAGVQSGIRKIQASGLQVSSLGWVGGFTGYNGYGFDEVFHEAKRAVRAAAQIQAPTVMVVTGPQNGHINSHARRLVIDALSQLGDWAGSHGVSISLQPMHLRFHRNWSFIHTLEEAIELLDRVNHPQLKVAVGTYHLGDAPDICPLLESTVGRIGVVQLADRCGIPLDEHDRCLPGEGELPLTPIIQTLERAGYSGWYETEVWSRDLWKLDHHDLIERCLRSQGTLLVNDLTESLPDPA